MTSTERLAATRSDLSFVLELVKKQRRWDNEDIDKSKTAIDTLTRQIHALDREMARVQQLTRKRAVLHRRLNVALYMVAALSALHLLFRAQLAFVPALAISVVFGVAIIRTNPETQWYRMFLASVLPVAVVVVLFSITPLKALVDKHNAAMGLIGLFYSISFALIGASTETPKTRW